MREFKFRAWDKDYRYMNHKVMVGNVWDEDNYHAHMIWVDSEKVDYECESGWMNFDEHSNIELMQYTGLKDKNGTEIYEGDIVLFDSEVYPVTFKNGNFGVKKLMRINLYTDEMREYQEPLWNLVVDGCEVIGNIHQHTELLGDNQ